MSIVYSYKDNLYLNITNQCPNDCYFCIRNFQDGISGFKLKLDHEPSSDEIIQELQNFINVRYFPEKVFCGFGEAMTRPNEVIKVTKWIKKYHPGVVRIDTNGQGYLLNSGRQVVEELKEAGVDKVSVSVNADNKELYDKICRPQFRNAFDSILEFVEKSRDVFETEISFVTIPEVDRTKMEELAKSLNVKLRERKYSHPIL